jgi:predicted ATPase/class 3 adenylate cyclase
VRVAELPTGTVTFLFTDLAESTRLWEDFPDDMRVTLARHDDILRSAIGAHDGHLVKMTGDGAHAAFGTAEDAVAAAVDAQLALQDETWGATGPLRVRMGLHTGSAEVRDGDYFGTEVNRAARVMAIAHGGQVLCSRTTADLTRAALPDGVALVDLHEQQLRDLQTPERIFQVTHTDLSAEFPGLRTLDAFPSNLPLQVTEFVGREEELADLGKLLTTARVVTLTGSGGVGKTRLALQAAADALPHHSDGAWFVDLAPIDDGELVASEIVTTMGLPEFRHGSREDALVAALARRDALVVLDNCEHLVDTVAEIVELIVHNCRSVTVLATSQEGLGVDGEVTLPVRPMHELDAERLFVERARAARHGFEVTEENRATVEELCRRLDGIPLAIELAAARVGSMSPGAILERLDERFRLLGHGRRTARRRHQTLRAAVDWSYGLLSTEEQLAFQRLSVFAGSFSLAAAEAVVADDESIDAFDVVDLVTGLVAKSIVQLDERAVDDRYRLLETMRDYGLEHLAQRGELDAFQYRHSLHYLAFAEEAAPQLRGPEDDAWLERLNDEHANLRAALTHLRERDDDAAHLRLVIALAMYWWNAGLFREGLECVTAAATLPCEPSTGRSEALAIAANLAVILDRYDEAAVLVEESLACSRAAGVAASANASLALALTAMVQNRPDEACRFSLEGVELARENGDAFDLAQVSSYASTIIGLSSDDPIAFELADEAVAIARELGNSTTMSMALQNSGTIWCRRDPERSIQLFDEGVHGVGRHRGRSMHAMGRTFKAVAHLLLRQYPEAAAELCDVLPTLQEGGEPYQESIALGVAAIVLSRPVPDVAVQVLGLIDRLRDDGVFIGAAGDLDAQEHLRRRLEERVEPDRYARAWSEGREMTLDDAIAVAVEALVPIAESA